MLYILYRYYYCVRSPSNKNGYRVHFETGAVYTILLGNDNGSEVK